MEGGQPEHLRAFGADHDRDPAGARSDWSMLQIARSMLDNPVLRTEINGDLEVMVGEHAVHLHAAACPADLRRRAGGGRLGVQGSYWWMRMPDRRDEARAAK